MAARGSLGIAIVLLALFAASEAFHGYSFRRRSFCWIQQQCETVRNCSKCNLSRDASKNVTLRAINQLKEPRFTVQVALPETISSYLFYMMEEAAELDSTFRFTASYDYAGHPGYFINAINGVWETWDVDQSYWEILDGDLKQTPVGASSYVPKDGEVVTFNLTTWSNSPH